MSQLGQDFRNHVLSLDLPGCTVEKVDDDHIRLHTGHALGQVNFYAFDDAPEIVELRISDIDALDDPSFFLHFELEDKERAKELLAEMTGVLSQQDHFDTRRVLLCCTAGLTTAMFAMRLNEAAKTLSIDYDFEAMPLTEAKAKGGDWDAVLLAPQVGYQRKAVVEAFPDAAVVQIPAKVFASYDAGACIKMVMHLLSDNTVFSTSDEGDLEAVRDLKNDKRIMVVSLIKRPRNSWLGWRIYDKGQVAAYGSVTKSNAGYRDVEDLLGSLHVLGWDVGSLDAVGIAVPGVVNKGTVVDRHMRRPGDQGPVTDYEMGRILSKRFNTKVFVDNNANAAAVGCYVSQTEYDSVILHTQQTGSPVGGQGIVVDGHLLKGRKNFAGELFPLANALNKGQPEQRWEELAWSPEGMRQIVAPILAADVALVAPDAIYVAVDLLDDMDALRDEMVKYFMGDDTYIPDLVRVTDYRERIALGELALCLQKLHNPRPHRKH